MIRRRRPLVVAVLSLVLALQLAVLAAWWAPVFGNSRVLVVAHHGDVAHWPEDTIQAFEAAATSGADGIEIDVQTSADGTWWAFHDAGLERLTDHVGSFATLTDTEVTQLRVVGGMGSAVAPPGTYRVSRLSDIMSALAGYPGILILDVKTTAPAGYRELARMLGNRVAYFICSSADGAAAIKAVNPTLLTVAPVVVRPRSDIDLRLLDARTQVRSPLDLWFGGPTMLYENGADYGHEDSEWFRRARTWGAELYLTNHIAATLQELGGSGSGT